LWKNKKQNLGVFQILAQDSAFITRLFFYRFPVDDLQFRTIVQESSLADFNTFWDFYPAQG
jgi:hypothetical protein